MGGNSYIHTRSVTRLLAESGRISLRWSDSSVAPALETVVELVDPDNAEPIVRAPLRIVEETPVTLLADGYMVNGIVRFCRADKESYLIAVAACEISEDHLVPVDVRDPGVLAVDDFLTEEEEAKILESLQDSFCSGTSDSRFSTARLELWRVLQLLRLSSSLTGGLSPAQGLAGLRCGCC